ncbi:MAG: sugar ABC transporter ATP-binding protein [Anaerolineales bacterium]|nr:sugar ABC transporter ATP-binding protein [Anaerolineales bacterium]
METDTILQLNGITKRYPGTLAVDHVDLAIRRGEVHAIVGENGAGKSTLIKMLSGAVAPTAGSIQFDGETFSELTPETAIAKGIGVIYQEFNLVPGLSIAANIFLGREFRQGMFINDRQAENAARKLIDEWQVNLDPRAPVKSLSIAEQQIVEIIKAISQEVKLLIMDEPTASLTLDEVRTLFGLTRQLKERGVTVIYISHRLEEIFELCDRVSVLRDGHHVTTLEVADTNEPALIRFMVGREIGDYPKKAPPQPEVLLSVRQLSDGRVFRDVSFELHRGEILGMYALIGAGRTDVALTLFGAKPRRGGEVHLRGRPLHISSPAEAVAHGLGLVPEDRKGQGLILSMRSSQNMTLSAIETLSSQSFIRLNQEDGVVKQFQAKLRMQAHVPREEARNLSGGTQQKVVLAKLLARQADVILFDEPTRGIDVGAKHEIYELMVELCREGKAILMISSELPELLGMSDRILVMRAGRLMGEFARAEATEEKLLSLAAGREAAVI